jgi:hypothetical protein
MKSVVLLVAVLATSVLAHAEIVSGPPNIDGMTFARQVIPAGDAPPASGLVQSRIIYLNKNGITLAPGDNDSRTNKSTMITRATTIPAWNVSDTTWNATVACMKELFAPFDVTIVTADPGASPHIEAVFGGTPSMMAMPDTTTGVAPFKSDCTPLENAIVFTFTAHIPQDARLACEIQAQEVAHAFGLDHERLPGDPMTYMRFDGNRSFQNQLAECGEDKARMCGVPNAASCRGKQNSVQLLFERLGAKAMPGDFTAPTVTITSPANGATVAPGFEVTVNAADNTRVTMASIYIDNVPSGSSSTAPWTIKTPSSMVRGERIIKVEVTDGRQTKSHEIRVNVQGGGAEDDSNLDGGCNTTQRASLGIVLLVVAFVLRSRSRRT